MSAENPISLCVKDEAPPSYSSATSQNRNFGRSSLFGGGVSALSQSTSTYSFSTGNYVPAPLWSPHNAVMEKYEKRLGTFDKWPKQMRQKAEEMALSGFYYGGVGDLVVCFYCNIRLRNWDKYDDVKYEHHKHSSQCRFLHMIYKA